MMNNSKILGGIFLVSGTAIGAGMLALPISTASNGFIPSIFSFVICWFFITIAALLFLEVNLSLSGEKDLISIAEITLGTTGKIIASTAYLLLLYALIAAHLIGGSAWLIQMLEKYQIHLSPGTTMLLLALLFGGIVSHGTFVVAQINRYVMAGLILAYFILIGCALPSVEWTKLSAPGSYQISSSFSLLVTAFGFSVIVPTLTDYLHRDIKALRYVIIGGSLIPLGVYLLWEMVTLGIIPRLGPDSFQNLIIQRDDGTGVAIALEHIVGNLWITQSSRWFSILALITSWLGVSLALFHFLKDVFNMKKKTRFQGTFLGICTYLPPLLSLLIYSAGFSKILGVAGIFVAVLLGILPAVMVWRRRYAKGAVVGAYQVFGGKGMLIAVMVFFAYVTYLEIYHCFICP